MVCPDGRKLCSVVPHKQRVKLSTYSNLNFGWIIKSNENLIPVRESAYNASIHMHRYDPLLPLAVKRFCEDITICFTKGY